MEVINDFVSDFTAPLWKFIWNLSSPDKYNTQSLQEKKLLWLNIT